MFIKTIDILNAWVKALQNITLPDQAQPMFTDVGIFANKNLTEAMKVTFSYDDRVCFLVPTAEEYENIREGELYITKRITEITMLFSDRDYSLRTNALTGSDGTVGVLAMKEQILQTFLGQNLGIPGVRLEPHNSEAFLIADAQGVSGGDRRGKIKGREGWAIQWRTDAGRQGTRTNRFSS